MKKLLGYSAFVAFVLILFAGFFLYSWLMQYHGEIARLESVGSPVTLQELNHTAAEANIDATEQFNQLLTPIKAFATQLFSKQKDPLGQTDEELIQQYQELVTAYPTVYPLLSEIANADFVGFEVADDSQTLLQEQLDRMPYITSCARVLQFKSQVLLAQGKPDEALAAAMEIFGLCRAFANHPTIVADLVRQACRGMAIGLILDIVANHELTNESRDRLNQVLEREDAVDIDEHFQALQSERVFGIACLDNMGVLQMALSGKKYLDLMQQELDQCQQEAFEQDLSYLSYKSSFGWMRGWLAHSVLPAMQQLRIARFRTTSQIRGLRIINALQSNSDSKDQEITQQYLKKMGVPEAMIVDTMDGKPMRVKRRGDSWVVYSVGLNQEDDGGTKQGMLDFVIGPGKEVLSQTD